MAMWYRCMQDKQLRGRSMDNNKVLKKIVIACNLQHSHVKEIFKQGGHPFSTSEAGSFLVSEKNKNFNTLSDERLSDFLDALIRYSRGEKGDSHNVPMVIKLMMIAMSEKKNMDGIEEIIEFASDLMGDMLEGDQ